MFMRGVSASAVSTVMRLVGAVVVVVVVAGVVLDGDAGVGLLASLARTRRLLAMVVYLRQRELGPV
jgi:hypothetical protein